MIDEVDARLREWVGSVAGTVAVRLEAPGPGAEQAGAGVGLYLLELGDAPPAPGGQRAAQQIHLRYLVTAWGAAPEEGHRLLGELLFSALDREDMEVDLSPLPAGLWHAFGLAPRPAFALKVPLCRERQQAAVPRVRAPLVTRTVPSEALAGQVLGPGEVPLAAAVVELPSLQLRTRTDFQGRFRFPRVPVEPRTKLLRVHAKGEVRTFTAEPGPGEAEPLTIRFQLEGA